MNLAVRVASAAVLLAVVLPAIILGGAALDTVVALAALLGTWEVARILRQLGAAPLAPVAYPLALVLALRPLLPATWPVTELAGAAACLVALGSLILTRGGAARAAASLLAGVYLGLLGFFLALDMWHSGAGHDNFSLLALVLGGAAVSDSGAYFVGLALGRHRFFPAVSPRKSVEGAVGGLVLCTAAVGAAAPLLLPVVNPLCALGLGAGISIAAQAGDLAESALKREAGVKDSSGLIPGHGGLLDRLDSLLFVAPVAYCYLKVIGVL